MNRVSTLSENQFLVNTLMNNQQQMQEAQQQVTTGHKSQDYKGIADQAEALIGSQSVASRTQQYISGNNQLNLTLQTYDATTRGLASNAQAIKDAVMRAISTNSSSGLIDSVTNLLSQSLGQLNTQLNGQYIYGGTRTDTPPVNITTPAQLVAMGQPPSAAFSNNQLKPQAQVNDNVTITYGQLANQVGQPLLQSIQRILQYNNGTLAGPSPPGPGTPFSDPMTQAQKDFLTGELSSLSATVSGLNAAATQNGVLQQQLDNVQQQNQSQLTTVNSFISDVQDADAAQAITKLNQDQLALQASYHVVAQLGKLSLANFL